MRRALRRYWPVVGVAVAGLVLSAVAFFVMRHLADVELQSEFDRAAGLHALEVERKVEELRMTLNSIRAFYEASNDVSRHEFGNFVQPLLAHLHGIRALQWVPRVRDADRGAYEAAARKEGLAGYQFTQRGPDGTLVRAGRRDTYYPVYFSEPRAAHGEVMGFDLASEPGRRHALAEACDANRLAATRPLQLLEEHQGNLACLLVLPVYGKNRPTETLQLRRRNLMGFAVGVVQVAELVEGAIEGLPPSGIDMQVVDLSSPQQSQTLFRHASRTREDANGGDKPRLIKVFTFQLGDRRWSVNCTPAPAFLARYRSLDPWGVLAVALMLTLLAAHYAAGSINQTAKVQRLVDERTAQLVSSEQRIRKITAALGEGLYVLDRAGRATFVNPAAEQFLGWTEGELLGEIVHDRIHVDAGGATSLRADCPVCRVMESGEPCRDDTQFYVRKDGTVFPVELVITPLVEGGAIAGSIIAFQDITERRQAEEALRRKEEEFRQAQKLEAIGALAGGVAHEFNNLLQAIRAFARFAQKDLAPEERRYRDIEEVLKAAERASTLTRQLLGFARRQRLQPGAVDPNAIVADLQKMLELLVGEKNALKMELGQGVGWLHADATMLQQAVLNLCLNARDAMPDGGTIVVRTEGVTLVEPDRAGQPEVPPGRYVRLTVSDTGQGMTPDVLEHVFEPFYTTKEIGKGTGLGLAMVYGMVRQHRGVIRVRSQPGEGTEFDLYLPSADGASPPDAAGTVCPTSAAGEPGALQEVQPCLTP